MPLCLPENKSFEHITIFSKAGGRQHDKLVAIGITPDNFQFSLGKIHLLGQLFDIQDDVIVALTHIAEFIYFFKDYAFLHIQIPVLACAYLR